jgi:hypothetical protein
VRLSRGVLKESTATGRKVATVAHIWSTFVQTQQSVSGMPGIEEIVAYLYYRVATR